MAKLEQVLKGIKSVQCKNPSRKLRLPILPHHLAKMRRVWMKDSSSFDGTMLWAAASLCLFGFFRSGEMTIPTDLAFDEGAHLCFNDVSVNNLHCPQIIRVHLKASKTDPFRVGVNIFVGKLCPVTAVLSYMVARGDWPGPFSRFQDGKPLTRARFVSKVKETLTVAGVDSVAYSGHSCRSGAATTAAK